MLTTRQMAEKLNCCEKTVIKMAKAGEIEYQLLNINAKRPTYRFPCGKTEGPRKLRNPTKRFV